MRGTKLPSVEDFFGLKNKVVSPELLLNVEFDFEEKSWVDSETREKLLSFVWKTGFPHYYDTLQTRSVLEFLFNPYLNSIET